MCIVCIGSLYSQNNNEVIANNMISIESKDNITYDSIYEVVKDYPILILGENGHGDGATFTFKGDLIMYLLEKQDYTIMFEGLSFFSAYVFQTIPDVYHRFGIGKFWAPIWTFSEQTQDLISYINREQTPIYGIDNQATYFDLFLLDSLNRYCQNEPYKLMSDTCDFEAANALYKPFIKMLFNDHLDSLHSSTHHLKAKIQLYSKLLKQTQDTSYRKQVLLQALDNSIAFIKQSEAGFNTFEEQNVGINIRDQQMAENVKWFHSRFPNKKLIIWAANFHANKSISDIVYGKAPDPELYDSFTTMGTHLKNMLGEENVCAVGFTSSTGQYGTCFDTVAYNIDVPKSSLEYLLAQKKTNYGLINAKKVKATIGSPIFKSTMMGGDEKSGKWLNAFDIIIYIRENEKSKFYK